MFTCNVNKTEAASDGAKGVENRTDVIQVYGAHLLADTGMGSQDRH